VVRAQDYGGPVFEDDKTDLLAEAMAAWRKDSPRTSSGRGSSDEPLPDIPLHRPDELPTTLLAAADVRVERIVSYGHVSPEGFWYGRDRHEWVVLVAGATRLRFGDGVVGMRPGSVVNIPAHRRHRVEWTTPDEPTIWLASSMANGFIPAGSRPVP
jgi:cupin 2 domain-containing protein